MSRTPEELEQLGLSVSYEAGTLLSQGILYLRDGAALAKPTNRMYPTADALFDSLLTKLRSLDGFFTNQRHRPTDAIAKDLVPTWQPRGILSSDERTTINVRIAHLTYLRPAAHEWDIGLMVRKALETMSAFIQAAGPDAVDNGQYRIDEITRELNQWNDLDEVKTKNDNHAYR